MFPRQFLSSHFWSIQQKFDFRLHYLRRRLTYNLPVFRYMQSKLSTLKSNHEKFEQCRHIFGRIGSGLHPTTQEIMDIKEIFTEAPYSLDSMPQYHLVIY